MKIDFLNTWLQNIFAKLHLKWHLSCFRLFAVLGKSKFAMRHLYSIPLPDIEAKDFDTFLKVEIKLWHKYIDKQGNLKTLTFKNFLIFLLKSCFLIFFLYILILSFLKGTKILQDIHFIRDKGNKVIESIKYAINSSEEIEQYKLMSNNKVPVRVTTNPIFKKGKILIPIQTRIEGKDSITFIPDENFIGSSAPLFDSTYIRSFINIKNDTIFSILSPHYSIKKGQVSPVISRLLTHFLLEKNDTSRMKNNTILLKIKSTISLHETPGINGKIIIKLAAGEKVQFQQLGPVASDFIWFFVNYSDTSTQAFAGWIAACSIKKQFIEIIQK